MKGINFEEWKALVKKNRQALNTKSNIYRTEPENLTWGAEKAVKTPEYGQMHTITYNVTGMEVPSDWPTEIKSGKTLSLSIPAAPYGASQTVAANVDYTYTNDVLKINNVLNDITITINIGEVLYENAKIGDYLYSDWTFGPTEKPGYLGRCVGLATDNEGKSVWCSPKSSSKMYWSTEAVDTGLDNFTSYTAKTDFNGKSNTELLLSLGADKYLAAKWASEQFQGNGYLPAEGELYKNRQNIKTFTNASRHLELLASTQQSRYIAYTFVPYDGSLGYISKTQYACSVCAFLQLSGKPGKPINANGHEYVDLGLPSGTLWATMNVGANSETDAGLYFAWGDTQGYTSDQVGSGEGQKAFSWADYKFNPSGDGSTMSKYNETDGKTVLDLEDDAARVNWGGDWKMPTALQLQELLISDNCTYTRTTVNGINGLLFTSVRNGNTLFIPNTGYAYDDSMSSAGSTGRVWGSSLYNSSVDGGHYLGFSNYYVVVTNGYRCYGQSVRGVIG